MMRKISEKCFDPFPADDRISKVNSIKTFFAVLGVLCLAVAGNLSAQPLNQTENVFLITLDGFRWQELFSGADPALIGNEDYVDDVEDLKNSFWDPETEMRRRRLMPFFWEVIATQGQLYGNRKEGCTVDVTNNQWFSYPGYSEILVGYVDPGIDSNDKIPNPNKTVLEFINEQPISGGG